MLGGLFCNWTLHFINENEYFCSVQQVIFEDLGCIDYHKAWNYQSELASQLIQDKKSVDPLLLPHRLLFCEHPHTYTLGKSGSENHLLVGKDRLAKKKIDFVAINRGGDITYHGPGQLVGYPIFDMDRFFNDVHKYVRFLEEAVIILLQSYGLDALRIEGKSGVWLPPREGQMFKKIMAVGIHMSRWVSMHGFALNVNTELKYFAYMIPCGISELNKGVTSLHLEIGQPIDMTIIKEQLKYIYSELFGFEFV